VADVDLVINCAAYTKVDLAEKEPEAAFQANRDGPAHLAAACRDRGIPLLHVSTDYVFDGSGSHPYREDEPVNPLGVYGASKEAGERAVRATLDRHVILRTAWVFSDTGQNFVRTMLRLGAEREALRVVNDQTGGPTDAADIATTLLTIADRVTGPDAGAALFGTFHYCGAPSTTWHGFAASIFDGATRRGHRSPALSACTTADYPTPARRPAWSVLDCGKLMDVYGIPQPDWRVALDRVLTSLLRPAG